MDGETIRLIVVALGATVAGAAGALIAGAFNSENTQATIAAARDLAEDQRDGDRALEHDRWLRDRKVEVYSQFLEDVHELRLSIAEIQVGYNKDAGVIAKHARSLSLQQLRVLAPRLVLAAAQEVMQSISNLTNELIAIKERTAPNMAAYEAAADDFRDKVTLLELRVSHDLGIDVVA